MAEERTITTSFKADISQFSASTQQLNQYIKTVNSEFANATAGLGRWSDSTDGLTAKITQLNRILEAEKLKLGNLESAYKKLVDEGKANTKEAKDLAIAINNQSAKVKQTQSDIEHYTSSLNELESQSNESTKSVKKLNDEVSNAGSKGEGFKNVAGGIAKGIAGIATACVGAIGSLLALGESTRELRKQLGQLETSFSQAGFSAETAESTFENLYGVLGDEGKATEASLHLAQLANSEEELANYTDILTGVYATFGDSLPVEGLAEAMNHTAELGSVQGNLADALEWSGVNVDDFNKQLEACNSEEERTALITETLNGLYGETAEKYKEVNKDIIKSQEAQMNLNNALAKLGEIAEPIMTLFKNLLADILEQITPFVSLIGEGLKGAFEGSAEAGQLFAEGLSGIINMIVEKATELLPKVMDVISQLIPSLLSIILEQLPSVLQMGIEVINNLILGISEMLPSLIPQAIACIMTLVETLLNNIDSIIDAGISLLEGLTEGIINAIPILIEKAPTIIEKLINAILSNLPKILNLGIKLLLELGNGLIKAIPQLLSKVPQIIISLVKGIITEGIPALLNAGKELIKGLWEGIKSMGDWLFKQISGFFNGVVDGIKDFFGIHSPSRVFKDEIGKNLALGIGEGFNDELNNVSKSMQSKLKGLTPQLALAGGNIEVNNNGSMLHEIASLLKQNQAVNNTTNNFNYTFEKMETTKHALHKAQIETKRMLGRK